MTLIEAAAELPEWAEVFWEDGLRHIGLKGGRGAGAKSRTTATALLIQGNQSRRRVLCAREIQRSIRDSVKTLLDDQINRLGMGQGPGQSGFYRSTGSGIYGANGTRFLFAGLRQNVEQLKSLEGITDVWVEEARTISQDTIDTLEPTIRAPGSRFIWTYNPRLKTDPIDAMLCAKPPPPRTKVLHLKPDDNPWFPEVLWEKMMYDRRRDYARYRHIWLGDYWERDDAKVFTDWEIAPFDTPDDAILRFGADWGFSVDPTVLIRCFLGWFIDGEAVADSEGDTLFIDREAWQVKCPIVDTPALFAGDDTLARKPRWENPHSYPGIPGSLLWEIVADSARPETIAHMSALGFPIVPAIKGPGSIEDGVEFVKSYRVIIHPRCTNAIDEFSTYSYKVDKLTEQVLPVLADKDNNTIDAIRYAVEAVRRAGNGRRTIRSASPRQALLGHKTPAQAALDADKQGGNTGRGWGSAPSRTQGLK